MSNAIVGGNRRLGGAGVSHCSEQGGGRSCGDVSHLSSGVILVRHV